MEEFVVENVVANSIWHRIKPFDLNFLQRKNDQLNHMQSPYYILPYFTPFSERLLMKKVITMNKAAVRLNYKWSVYWKTVTKLLEDEFPFVFPILSCSNGLSSHGRMVTKEAFLTGSIQVYVRITLFLQKYSVKSR